MAKKKAARTRKHFDPDKKKKAVSDVKALVAKGKSQNQACKIVADKLGTSSVTVYSWLKGPAKGSTKKKAKVTRKRKTVTDNGSIRESLIAKIGDTLSDERLLEIVLEECIS